MSSLKQLTRNVVTISTFLLLQLLVSGVYANVTNTPGSLAGSFGVNGGNANYSVPIVTPPMRGGMSPEISLNYSSAASNGPLGLGWSVGGASTIHRCARTKMHDGVQGTINFDENDRFCVDGQRLIETSANPSSPQPRSGTMGTTYKKEFRTELDSYTRIIGYFYGSSADESTWEPVFFAVWTKSGLTKEYGATSDSRIDVGNKGTNVWAISSVADSTGNNTIEYAYEKESTHYEYRMSRVTSGDVYIEFKYQPRKDITKAYLAGVEMQLSKRIEKISTGLTVNGIDNTFREYIFGYQYTPENANTYSPFSQLTFIQECGYQEHDGVQQCHEPTTFEWNATAPTLGVHSMRSASYNGGQIMNLTANNFNDKEQIKTIADVDGDGVADLVGFGNDGVHVSLGNGDGSFAQPNIWIYAFGYSYGWRTDYHVRTVADVNGDGRSDVVAFDSSGVILALSDGEKFVLQGNNGDGRVSKYFGYNSEIFNGACKNDSGLNFGDEWIRGVNPRYLADMNGDGKADIIGFGDVNCDDGTWVALSTGNGFEEPKKWIDHYTDNHGINQYNLRVLQDMNGDGMTDLVVFLNRGIDVNLSTGTTFNHIPSVSLDYCNLCYVDYTDNSLGRWDWGTEKIQRNLADVNGDGFPDIVGFGMEGVYVSLSTGVYGTYTGFTPKTKVLDDYDDINGWNTKDHLRTLADVNGDGKADLVAMGKGGIVVHFSEVFDENGDGNAEFRFSGAHEYSGNIATGFAVSGDNPQILRTVLDLNGDGFADVLGLFGDGVHPLIRVSTSSLYKQIKISTGSENKHIGPPQLISAIQDAMNNRIEIDYKSMMDSDVYTQDEDGGGPGVSVRYPRYLVFATHTTKGFGISSKDRVDYHYGDFRVDVDGRGGLGFAWEEVHDYTANKITHTEFSQTFPYIGSPVIVEEYLAENGQKGILINRSSSTYTDISTTDRIFSPQLKKRIDQNFKLNSVNAVVSTKSVDNQRYDAYGNLELSVTTSSGGGKNFTTKTTSYYDNDEYKWHLGRLYRSEAVHTSSDSIESQLRISEFVYDPYTGLLAEEKVEPTDPQGRKTLYERDGYGNVTSVTTTSIQTYDQSSIYHVVPRVQTTVFDNNNKFPYQRINAKGHTETVEYNQFCGEIDYLIGPNGVETRWEYDAFCRKTKEVRDDGTETVWNYDNYTGSSFYSVMGAYYYEDLPYSYNAKFEPAYPVFTVTEQVRRTDNVLKVLPAVITIYDSLGREIRQISMSFDGTKNIYKDTIYNQKGKAAAVSLPYSSYETSTGRWVESKYDEIGRLIRVSRPSTFGANVSEGYIYNGLEKTHINVKGYRKTTYSNAKGQVIRVEEEEGAWVEYGYDPVGNLVRTNASGVITEVAYDVFGNKIAMGDPDMGYSLDDTQERYWQYKYNAFGELVWQRDANGNEVFMTYDKLGRMVQRVENEGTTVWQYDTALNGIGKLEHVAMMGVERTEYQYDMLGRLSTTINKLNYISEQNYDEYITQVIYDDAGFGQVSKEIRPGGFEVENVYNEQGYLVGIRSPKNKVADYDYTHLMPLILETNRQISDLTYQARDYEEQAAALRSQAWDLQAQAEVYFASASIGRDEFVRYVQDGDQLLNLADDLELRAEEYWDKARYYEKLRVAVVVEAVGALGYSAVFADPEPVLVPIMVGDIQIFVPLSDEGVAALDAPLTSYFYTAHDAYFGTKESEYRSQANAQIELAEQYLAEAALRRAEGVNSQGSLAMQALANAQGAMYFAMEKIEQADALLVQAESLDHKEEIEKLLQDKEAYETMRDNSSEYIYHWQAIDRDSGGRLTDEVAGNGLTTQYDYDSYTGQLHSVRSGFGYLGDTRHIEYEYDDLNNVKTRNNYTQGINELFTYDSLDRLTGALTTATFGGNSYGATASYQYDAMGNITYKSDVGYYSYGSSSRMSGNAGPHALRSAGDNHLDYQYDNNGNLLSGGDRNYQWSSFNKPTQITKGGQVVQFTYGVDRNRVKKVSVSNSGSFTTDYVGKIYERVSEPNEVIKHKHFIYAEGRVVATHIETTIAAEVQPYETHYLHYDALGSVDTITDNNGEIVACMSYDAFGKRRYCDPNGVDLTSISPLTMPFNNNLGYTGHEHIEEVGLIHMNGRVYDPEIGRFISADSIIPDANNSQAYNRYSYVYNSPLKYADPSGHFPVVYAIIFVMGAMMAQSDNPVISSVGMIMMAWAGGQMYAGLNVQHAAFWGSVSAGFVGGYAQTGTLHGAVKGAAIAAFTAGVGEGSSGLDIGGKMVVQGLAGGLVAEVQGGEFGSGFLAGAASAAGGEIGTTGDQLGDAMVAGMVGGTVSEMSGGSFANGAVTAAFSSLMSNVETPEEQQIEALEVTYADGTVEYYPADRGVDVAAGPLVIVGARLVYAGASYLAKQAPKYFGRAGKQARLKELANDPKLGKADRGWIKQEQNSIARGSRKTIRNPPGKDLAHERGREAAKGYSYKYSNLQDRRLHRLQHKYDNFGRLNKERPPQ